MEAHRAKKVVKVTGVDGTVSKMRRKYLHRLSMYALPPTEDVSLEEFEQLGLDRLACKLPP